MKTWRRFPSAKPDNAIIKAWRMQSAATIPLNFSLLAYSSIAAKIRQ
jgi:hypothetical protein